MAIGQLRAVFPTISKGRAMKYTQLGETSLTVSNLCYGTWQFGGDWGSFEIREAQVAIRQALELGITFFDTAQAYGFGRSEQVLGETLRQELKSDRDKITIATKGGLRMEGNRLVRDSSARWLRRGTEESLRNLGVDYIDLYQVHWPDPRTPFAETGDALEELVQAGKIRYAGVSNFDVAEMSTFQKTRRIDTLQPPYHLFRRDIEQDVLPYCQTHGIGVLVYGPLAHGLLGGHYTPQTTFASDDWRSKSPAFRGELFERNLAVVARLKALAERQGMRVAQLAVAWVLANPAVDVAIVGARHPKQLTDTAPAGDVKLSQETLQEIATIMKNAAPTGGPSPEGM
jgi:aryl-alcohol dehydrogenase-like predicted oxidoreductase